MANPIHAKTGICKLCEKQAELQLSHMHPKFLFNWLKQTGDGLLRSGSDFNIRRQDGVKVYMLCKSCEGIFGRLETYFSSKIFHPFLKRETEQIIYDERLFKFVISVLWRYIHLDYLETEKGTFSYPFIVASEYEWRHYLLSDVKPVSFRSMHLLPPNLLFDADDPINGNLVARLIRYMARNVDALITDNCRDYSVGLVKLPRFAFIIPMAGFNQNLMQGTNIDLEGGTYVGSQAIGADPLIAELLIDRARQIEIGLAGMSEAQKQKIAEMKDRKWDEIKDKDLGRVMRSASQFAKNMDTKPD
ncbi:hypothetical protein [Dyadobacter sp. 22481]|uniref:hypothetical protein n=1 Tax=Dyadobacter sp. 22481 TaxID=3453926 RepID=UPI003F86FF0B